MGDDDEYVVDFEVVEDADTSDDYQAAEKPRLIIPPAPVHPLSSFVTIVVDQVWGALEMGATLTVAGLPALIPLILTSGVICFVSVMLIQRYVDHDTWGPAIAKASAMGIAAGVPYGVAGTAAGVLLLGWAGTHSVEPFVRRYLPLQPK